MVRFVSRLTVGRVNCPGCRPACCWCFSVSSASTPSLRQRDNLGTPACTMCSLIGDPPARLYIYTSVWPSDFSTPLDRSELILRMSGGIECGEFAQSLRSVIDTFKVPIPKSSQTVGEITGYARGLNRERAAPKIHPDVISPVPALRPISLSTHYYVLRYDHQVCTWK